MRAIILLSNFTLFCLYTFQVSEVHLLTVVLTLTCTWHSHIHGSMTATPLQKLSACLCTALIGSMNHQSTHQPTFHTWEEGAQKEVKWISSGLNIGSSP